MTPVEPEDFRLAKLEELRRLGIDPYGGRFPGASPLAEITARFDELEGQPVRAAGRVAGQRNMGRAAFVDIRDWTGKVQLFFQLDRLGEDAFHVQQQIDAGDIIGVEGELGKTRTGEPTIFVSDFRLLAKALLNPPEKWHGLRDTEKRYRQRSVDLFTNDEVMACFLKRAEIVRAIRAFLHGRGFVEAETPMMQSIPGGAAARPFHTYHNALGIDLYLRIAPELYLKRLLVGGMEKVFEINRNFRNEGISTQHNPEFTMLEAYESYGDYETMMELTESLVAHLAGDVCGAMELPFGEHGIDYTPPWPRRRFWDLLEEHLGLKRGDEGGIRARAAEFEMDGAPAAHADWLAYHLFEKQVEEHLVQPVFVTEFPRTVSPLTRAKADDPDVVERFDLYVAGLEVGTAYTELNDPQEQERRFLEQIGPEEETQRIDEDFLRALACGMPPAGGLGVGIDRLVMALTDQASIRDVILFPLLRPEEGA